MLKQNLNPLKFVSTRFQNVFNIVSTFNNVRRLGKTQGGHSSGNGQEKKQFFRIREKSGKCVLSHGELIFGREVWQIGNFYSIDLFVSKTKIPVHFFYFDFLFSVAERVRTKHLWSDS